MDSSKFTRHSAMASQEHHQLHVIFIPLMAQGHMIPMIDIARLFAERDVLATIITSPFNAARFKSIINRDTQSGLSIRLVEIPFPSRQVGLPDGCENFDVVRSPDLVKAFFTALELLQQPVEQYLEEIKPLPNCIVSDYCLPWTSEIALKFHIPRLIFHGPCCYTLLLFRNLSYYRPHERVESESVPFVVPGIPHRIEITKAQLPLEIIGNSAFGSIKDQVQKAESTCSAIVANSFHELEPDYVEKYQMATGKRVWTIGPVSLCNMETSDKAERGHAASISESQCLSWLDSQTPKSVVYACFGSMCYLQTSQLVEIGLGLEASNKPFIWVIRRNGDYSSEVEKWLSEGFEERVKDRGLIIRGWAPQVLILSHPSTGGFLSHCGWNSTLESICAGVPILTWPIFGDQFFNEKLIVQVMKIGISLGVKAAVHWGQEKPVEMIKMEVIKVSVERLMDEREEVKERRKRARELREKAKEAMEEGGSSYINLTLLIEDLKKHASGKKSTQVMGTDR